MGEVQVDRGRGDCSRGDFEDVNDVCSETHFSLSLVGKLSTQKPFNVEAMKRTLLSIWRLRENVAIRMVTTNLFTFQFFCEDDKDRVLGGCLWSFDSKILLLKEIKGEDQPSDVTFSHSPFWIQLEDVPFRKRNLSFAYDLVEKIGSFLDFDNSDPLGWSEFMRVKVLVDITKPPRKGATIRTGPSSTAWIGFKYERLEKFCYFCGMIGNLERECQAPVTRKVKEGEKIVYHYGPWLTGFPTRRPRMSYAEREKERKWLERLHFTKPIPRRPSYNDPLVVKLDPPGVARKLLFSCPQPVSPRLAYEKHIADVLVPTPSFGSNGGVCGGMSTRDGSCSGSREK